jgi:hypothetical protein
MGLGMWAWCNFKVVNNTRIELMVVKVNINGTPSSHIGKGKVKLPELTVSSSQITMTL